MSKSLLLALLVSASCVQAVNNTNEIDYTSWEHEKTRHAIEESIAATRLYIEQLALGSLPRQDLAAIQNKARHAMSLFSRAFEKALLQHLSQEQSRLFNKALTDVVESDELTAREKLGLCLTLKLNYLETKRSTLDREDLNDAVKLFEERSLPLLDAYIQALNDEIITLENEIAELESEIAAEQTAQLIEELDMDTQEDN